MKTISLIVLLLLSVLLSAQTITVKQDGTGDFTTIQAAVDSAQNGDTVLVWPGIYVENVLIYEKSITLGSLTLTTGDVNYMYQTIIDGNSNGSCVKTWNWGIADKIIVNGFTITNGSGADCGGICGGGLFIEYTNIEVDNCLVNKNYCLDYGAGIYLYGSIAYLSNVTITKNNAYGRGGAILLLNNSQLTFDTINRCNIYENYAAMGTDIYSFDTSTMEVYVDTFTVENPNYYYVSSDVYTHGSIHMHILHHTIEQTSDNLYVSPNGDNNNSGLTHDSPLKNISYALLKAAPDSISPDTIHFSNGTYSVSSGEMFPLSLKSFVTLKGETKESTILDAENKTYHIYGFPGLRNYSLMSFTTTHGKVTEDYNIAGSIKLFKPKNIKLKNLCLRDNESFYSSTLSIGTAQNVIIKDVDFIDNIGSYACQISHYPEDTTYDTTTFIGCRFINNQPNNSGKYFYGNGSALMIRGTTEYNDWTRHTTGILINCFFSNNYTTLLSPILIESRSSAYLVNSTIVNNLPSNGSAVYVNYNCDFKAYNSIFYDKDLYELQVWVNHVGLYSSLIEGGYQDINFKFDTLELFYDSLNIESNPLFYNEEDSVYSLSAESPCIDAGTMDLPRFILDRMPATDLAGNPRIYGNKIDMGAFEWNNIGINENPKSNLDYLSVFPNPFSSQTIISAQLINPARINIKVYNSAGLLIKTLQNSSQPAGNCQIIWDGTDNAGNYLPAGVYIVVLRVEGKEVASVKVIKRGYK